MPATLTSTINITFKKHRSCRADEGDAWSCEFYLDGRKGGDAEYGGHGGPIDIHYVNDEMKALLQDYAASLPPQKCSFDDPKTGKPCMMDWNDELLLDEKREDMLQERELKRWCKTKVVFTTPDCRKGQYQQYVAKRRGESPEQVRDTVEWCKAEIAKEEGAVILNEQIGVWPK